MQACVAGRPNASTAHNKSSGVKKSFRNNAEKPTLPVHIFAAARERQPMAVGSTPDGVDVRLNCKYNMKVVWDEPKRLANLDKHGLDFADLNETFFDNALVLPTYNKRWAGIGKNIRGVIVVVFVTLGKEAVSVISMRPASKNERKRYAER
jgi:uncharacterized protein